MPGQTRIIAVANQKGGVGKTTTVVNLGAWLALQGAKVLLVDLDPQANATSGVGVDPRRATSNIYRILIEGEPFDDAIEATATRNLYCVPSTIDLAGAEIELVAVFSRELKLRRALEGLAGEFDYVLIDCPPSLGLLTINGLAAATELIVPIQCEYYALEGLGQLLKNVQLVRSSLNPRLLLAGIVLTMHDRRTRLSDQVADQVRGHFTGRVYDTVIPRSVRLSEAPSFGQPIALYDPGSRGSEAYRALAFEVALQSAGERVPALVGGAEVGEATAPEPPAGGAGTEVGPPLTDGPGPEVAGGIPAPADEEAAPDVASRWSSDLQWLGGLGELAERGKRVSSPDDDPTAPLQDGVETPTPAHDVVSEEAASPEDGAPTVPPGGEAFAAGLATEPAWELEGPVGSPPGDLERQQEVDE
ncbi:MAG: AAA family ATPase [Gaiellales bacterium]